MHFLWTVQYRPGQARQSHMHHLINVYKRHQANGLWFFFFRLYLKMVPLSIKMHNIKIDITVHVVFFSSWMHIKKSEVVFFCFSCSCLNSDRVTCRRHIPNGFFENPFRVQDENKCKLRFLWTKDYVFFRSRFLKSFPSNKFNGRLYGQSARVKINLFWILKCISIYL